MNLGPLLIFIIAPKLLPFIKHILVFNFDFLEVLSLWIMQRSFFIWLCCYTEGFQLDCLIGSNFMEKVNTAVGSEILATFKLF